MGRQNLYLSKMNNNMTMLHLEVSILTNTKITIYFIGVFSHCKVTSMSSADAGTRALNASRIGRYPEIMRENDDLYCFFSHNILKLILTLALIMAFRFLVLSIVYSEIMTV